MRVSVLIEVSNHFFYIIACVRTSPPPPPQKKIAERDYFCGEG